MRIDHQQAFACSWQTVNGKLHVSASLVCLAGHLAGSPYRRITLQ